MTLSIPGRPTAPAGGPSDEPAPIGPNQISAPTPIDTGGSAWWLFTSTEDGRVAFDSSLTDPFTSGAVTLHLYTTDLDLIASTGFGQLNRDVAPGDYLLRIGVDHGSPVTAYLRISPYAESTDWVTDDPIPIVAGPPSAMSWNHLPGTDGYPAPNGYQPAVLPNPVMFQGDLGEYLTYLDPWGEGIGYEGNGRIKHTPDPAEEALHPYQLPDAWKVAWLAALAGITQEGEDNFGDVIAPKGFYTDKDGNSGAGLDAPLYALWLSTRNYLDWPIGRETQSSAKDLTPPDGRQTIEDWAREAYWRASLSKAIHDGSDRQLDVTLTGEAPDDPPDDSGEWNLQWKGGPFHTGAPPTLIGVETRNVGRSDGDLTGGTDDPYGTWKWHVSRYPLVWDGDEDHQDGYWLQNADPGPAFPSVVAAGGAALSSGDTVSGHVVDGSVDQTYDPESDPGPRDYGFFHEVLAGDPMIPGDEVAVIDPEAEDWVPVMDDAEVQTALTYEAPIVASLMPAGFGSLWFGGLLEVRGGDASSFFPSLGLGPITEFGQSTLQFPGLRFIFQRDQHRWIKDPVLPDVISTVVRQYPRDDARGVSSAPRLWPPSRSRRIAGGYPGGSQR